MPATDPADRALRPSPDALLEAAEREARGKLKIFLGAAPGVGKTWEMLQSARRKKADGIDVVIGVVETHGRRETEALLAGLETIPQRRVAYKGRELQELDLDAVLARRPALVLIDELAHSNAPGSRHPKRYLDVEEILAAGIDVYTTLNVQHVESLNDVVARITRIRVRETVPDGILDRAAEIEVVDITPEELIERLREGKVYVRDHAERALKHYFSTGNLTALRELALRRTAQQVDGQMLSYMRSHAISGPWAAGDRVLVCVSERSDAQQLVRYARRFADRLQAPWTAVYFEGPRHHRLSEAERDRVAETLRMAARLGAETATLPGDRIADDILAHARESNITHVVIGKSERSRWFEMLHGSIVHDLVRRSGPISVHVVSGEGEPAAAARRPPAEPGAPPRPAPYLWATLFVALATAVGLAIDALIVIPNISLVFLAAVLATAVRSGLAPSVYASLIAVACYNFFFTDPHYTFTVHDPANVMALVFFLAVAVMTSGLAARARTQMVTARQRARINAELYAFSRKLAAIGDLDDLLWAAAHQIAAMLKVQVVILMPAGDRLTVRAGFPPEDRVDEADLAAASWAWAHDRAAGRGSDTLPGARRLFLPFRTGRGPVGMIGIERDRAGPILTPEERRLLDALADQMAIATERIQLAAAIDEAKLTAETERLRGALLTSISHDLRTPLAAILGAVTSLKRYGAQYDAATREEMLSTVEEEAERLNRFVANLLDMTRLDSGALAPKREMIDIEDVVGTALARAAGVLGRHRTEVRLDPGLPMLPLDFVLLEQVLFNLLDNAAKYAPTGTAVTVTARPGAEGVVIEVADEGPGIPAEDLPRIFDKFYRVRNADRQRAGTGLGLAVCRGFVEAMGGTIDAANRPAGTGAVFRIVFPAPATA